MNDDVRYYFFHINHWTNPFNKLEDKVLGQFKCWNNSLLNNRYVFFEELKDMLLLTNHENKRCKPLTLDYRMDPLNKEMIVYVIRGNGTFLLSARMIKVTSDLTYYPPEKNA